MKQLMTGIRSFFWKWHNTVIPPTDLCVIVTNWLQIIIVLYTGVDECLVNNGGCQQSCVDTGNSFYCVCGQGFTVYPDSRTCWGWYSGRSTNIYTQYTIRKKPFIFNLSKIVQTSTDLHDTHVVYMTPN